MMSTSPHAKPDQQRAGERNTATAAGPQQGETPLFQSTCVLTFQVRSVPSSNFAPAAITSRRSRNFCTRFRPV